MIYLKLFLTFLKIGAVSFGGGYGMISLISDDAVANGWLTEEMLMNFIAVAESTPGPIAVNIATFVGASQGGILGAFLATLGVVTPAFVVILIIASVAHGLLNLGGVRAFVGGIKPVIVGMIIVTALTMFFSLFFNLKTFGSSLYFDWRSLAVCGVLVAGMLIFRGLTKKSLSPIALILASAALGMLFYSI